MLTIIDSNNWLRRRVSVDNSGSPLRNLFRDLQSRLIKGPVILVWDGYNANSTRRKIFPDYKMNRNPTAESVYESIKLMKQLATFTGAISVEVPLYEGDDVIAALVNKYRSATDIFIESNDMDLRQLNCPMARSEFPTEPNRIVLFKTLVGDPSDNIKGCVGFGEGAWKKLTPQNMDTIEAIIVSGWGLTADEVHEKVSSFFAPKSLKWFCDPENRKLLLTYYKIINFIPIPYEEISPHIKPGFNKPELAEKIFKDFML